MFGLFNTQGMTLNEVKRMNQMDDDYPDDYRKTYRNPYAYRKPVNKTPKVTVTHNADDVWAASWQAYVQNGNQYVKAIAPGISGHKTNRMLVEELLADTTQITQESREKGVAIRQYFKGLTFKVLQGEQLNDFNKTAMTISNHDTIATNYDVAVIVSLPATYEKSVKRDDVDRRINFASGGYLGTIGDKVTVEFEVVKQFWSQNWNTWYVTGITDDDKVLFFAYKNQMNIGERVKIRGTVKGTRDNSTQLNRVKVI